MVRRLRVIMPLALLVAMGGSVRAQYGYPPGYGGYGFGGWGGTGSTVQGSIAAGMGAFAAAAGQYNVETAQARSINAQTAMQWNDYMYAVNQQNARNEMIRLQKRQKRVNETADATYKRIHDNPSAAEIHSGDALNVILAELLNPRSLERVLKTATTPVDSKVVKSINFRSAANAVMISLDELSARGVPDVLRTSPEFEQERKNVRALAAEIRKEANSENTVEPATLQKFRDAVKAARVKVDATLPQGTRQRSESDNFLKALLGLSRMLEQPDVEQFLQGLNRYPTTSLGHLISFMHSFNLRFGVAKNPTQEAAYDQLYPMLVALRDKAEAVGPNPVTAEAPLPDPQKAASFFSGMDYSHVQPKAAVPAPPSPAQPR